MAETDTPTVTRYQMESVVPSWLGSDAGYLAGLKQALVNRMTMQGWDVVEGPRVEDQTNASSAVVPVGMSLLNVWCGVSEFDFEVPDELGSQPPASISAPRPAATQPEPYSEPT